VRELAVEGELPDRPPPSASLAAVDGRHISDEDYARFMQLPGYHRELDVVAVTPQGVIAAYVMGWIDRLTASVTSVRWERGLNTAGRGTPGLPCSKGCAACSLRYGSRVHLHRPQQHGCPRLYIRLVSWMTTSTWITSNPDERS